MRQTIRQDFWQIKILTKQNLFFLVLKFFAIIYAINKLKITIEFLIDLFCYHERKIFNMLNKNFVKTNHKVVSLAAVALTLMSTGAGLANAPLVHADSEVDVTKKTTDISTKQQLQTLVKFAQSSVIQDKVKKADNANYTQALKSAVADANKVLDEKAPTPQEIAATGANVNRALDNVDKYVKRNLNSLVRQGKSKLATMQDGQQKDDLKKALDAADDTNQNRAASLVNINEAYTATNNALTQAGFKVDDNGNSSNKDSNSSSNGSSSNSSSNDANNNDGNDGIDPGKGRNDSDNNPDKPDYSKDNSNSSNDKSDKGDINVSENSNYATLQNLIKQAESGETKTEIAMSNNDTYKSNITSQLDDAVKSAKALTKDSKDADITKASDKLVRLLDEVKQTMKEPLQALVNQAVLLERTHNYSDLDEVSKASFNDLVQTANNLLQNPQAQSGDILLMDTRLQQAIDQLADHATNKSLKAMIEAVTAFENTPGYAKLSSEQRSLFEQSLNSAKQVADNSNASQADIDKATTALLNNFDSILSNDIIQRDDALAKANKKLANYAKNQVNSVRSGAKKTNRSKSTASRYNDGSGYRDNSDPNDRTSDNGGAYNDGISSRGRGKNGSDSSKNGDGSNGSGSSDNSGDSNDGSNSSDNSGNSRDANTTPASSQKHGVLPQTGHYIMAHAKAIIGMLTGLLAIGGGALYVNNRKKTEDEEDGKSNK